MLFVGSRMPVKSRGRPVAGGDGEGGDGEGRSLNIQAASVNDKPLVPPATARIRRKSKNHARHRAAYHYLTSSSSNASDKKSKLTTRHLAALDFLLGIKLTNEATIRKEGQKSMVGRQTHASASPNSLHTAPLYHVLSLFLSSAFLISSSLLSASLL